MRSPYRWPECPGKTTYPSEGAAWGAAVHAMKRRSRQLFTYFCKKCRGWHLTKTDRLRDGDRPRP